MSLTPLALENAAVLRRLARPDAADLTFAALADALGRDTSNLRKTLQKLEADGAAHRLTTGCGWRAAPDALAALDRLDGLAGPDAAPLRWPLDQLVADPTQPRKAFDEDALLDLARSIASAEDVLVPLLVLPPDASGARTIKAGERRWRACRLLAQGLVDDCALPPALDPNLGGGLPIREIAPEAGDAAWIALTENGNRVDLNPIEDGEALLALMTARGWSAREAAHRLGRVGKSTGQPGAGSDGVKTVQERVKVAREATPENKARFVADPDFTWKDLLATVQAARPEGAFAPRDYFRLDPEVEYDIDAMPGWAMKGLTARISLARSPAGGWAYGYRYQDNESGASTGLSAVADEHTGLATRAEAFARAAGVIRGSASGAGQSQRATVLRVRALEWLAALGDGTVDPADIPARRPTVREQEADRIARGEGGASAPARRAAEPAVVDAPSETRRQTYTPCEAMVVALAEVCHVHILAGRGDTAFLPWAPTHQYWLDGYLGDAIAADLIRIVHGAAHPPQAMLTDAGIAALITAIAERTGGEVDTWPMDADGSWSLMRLVYRTFSTPGALAESEHNFLTPWLNLPTAEQQVDIIDPGGCAPPVGAAPIAPVAHDDVEDDRTLEDILGPLTLLNIVEAADPANGPAFLSGLFARVGFQPPFVAGMARDEEGVVHDARGRVVLTCDQHGDETHDMALAQAIVVAAALNAAVGLSVDVTPAEPATPQAEDAA